jgi:hypothetical protein
MNNWLTAFLFTQAIEIPLYLWAGRSVPAGKRLAAAAGASALTHPLLWFCFPWDPGNYLRSLLTGECLVVLAETAVLLRMGFPRPLAVSALVNAASCGAGLLAGAALS